MKYIIIDYETRSELDIKNVGAWVYAEHPSTDILSMAYIIIDKEDLKKTITIDDVNIFIPEFFSKNKLPESIQKTIKEEDFLIVAHNSFFDMSIWNINCTKKFDWPFVKYTNWFCTSALAAVYGMPQGLETCAIALNLATKKDMDGHKAMLALSKPRKPTKNNKAKWVNDPVKKKQSYEYNKQDVLVSKKILETLPAMTRRERKARLLDQKINIRGVSVNQKLVKGAIILADKALDDANEKIIGITGGAVTTVNQTAKIKDFLNRRGCDVGSIGKGILEEYLNENENINPKVKQVINLRLSSGKAAVKKFQALKNRTAKDGMIHGAFRYHGARTGRWTSEGVQLQNLYRGTIHNTLDMAVAIGLIEKQDADGIKKYFGNIMETLASSVRFAFRAEEGKEFYSADLAQIELRLLLWASGEKKALRGLLAGKSLYIEMAEKIFNKSINKYENVEEYITGKSAILGCGYQMGWKRFIEHCRNNGVKVNKETAQKAIKVYRGKYKKVKKLWDDMQACAIQTVLTGQKTKTKKGIVFEIYKKGNYKWLTMRIFSGRKIYYFNPRVKIEITKTRKNVTLKYDGVNSVTKKWGAQYLYGGKATGHAIQGSARDVLLTYMFALDKEDYSICMTVHDEAVSEQNRTEKRFNQYLREMEKNISWLPGLQINAEGWLGANYKK